MNPLRRTPLVVPILIASVFFLIPVLFSLALRSQSTLFELPLTEDGYYLLSVSRNIAMGHGITIDGHQWTNGFQPLFAFLLVPIYAVLSGDRYASLHGVLALHVLIHIATAFVLGSIVKTALRSRGNEQGVLGYWLTVFLWLASRYVLTNSYNGLETGCVLFFYAIVWRLYQLNWLDGWKLFVFGVMLGLLVLARIDAAIFVAILSISELFRQNTSPPLKLKRAAAMASLSFAVSSPWWFYNLLSFGSLMPSSGTAQSAHFSLFRVVPMAQSLLQVWTPYLQLRWIEGVPQMLVQGCLVLILVLLFRKNAFAEMEHSATLRMGGILLLSTFVLTLYYLFFFGAAHFYGRYLSPYMLLAIPLAVVALAGQRFHSRWYYAIIVPVGIFGLVSIIGWDFQVWVRKSPFPDQVQLVQTNVPVSEEVSAGQSGTLGYFRDHVVNLDGKVNVEALHYLNNSLEYLRRRDIHWYCDWESGYLGLHPVENGWTVVATRGRFLLYHHNSY